ncbi:MAG: hypothetical protein LBC48_04510 [Dysgonamonadaceae bacterium]|jgi:hypothetical protein|nr:hypothetical protein [Dysgonamonadaceae bacterium]
MSKITEYLKDEKQSKRKGGLYHKTQVNLAYNSNRIEGSRLTEERIRAYPIDTCLSAQDTYTEWVNYFYGEK